MSPFSLRQLKATYALLQEAWHTTLLLDPLPWAELFRIHADLSRAERLLRLNKWRLP